MLRNRCVSLVRDDKMKYQEKLVQQFTNNPKALFKYVNLQRKVEVGVPALATPNGYTETPRDAANVFKEVFSATFHSASHTNWVSTILQSSETISVVEFSPSNVKSKLLALRQNSSPGIDNIHPKVLVVLAELLAEPLAACYSLLFSQGIVPTEWKQAIICPIYKKGCRSDPMNYRPIALLPIFSKVMESIVADALIAHFETENLITETQHGFRHLRSCITNLLIAREEWTKSVDNGYPADVIYVDFSKAFDRVNHVILLQKLRCYGVCNPLLTWLQAWLTNRQMFVRVQGSLSDAVEMCCGVPQGSVLGPLLFLIYINDLPRNLSSPLLMFADDCKIWRSVVVPNDRQLLQNDLNSLYNWSVVNDLPINIDKCAVISLRSTTQFQYMLENHIIPCTSEQKDLGIIIQNDLGNSRQCEKATCKANYTLGLLRRLFGQFSVKNAVKLISLYIRPHLEYAVAVWSPWLKKDIAILEAPQRRATKMIKGFSHLSYECRLKSLNLFSVNYRRLRGDMILTYKILTKPNHPCKYLLTPSCLTHLRGSSKKLKHSRCRLDCRHYCFSVRVSRTWNILPEYVVSAPTVDAFKNRFDAFMVDKAFTFD